MHTEASNVQDYKMQRDAALMQFYWNILACDRQ